MAILMRDKVKFTSDLHEVLYSAAKGDAEFLAKIWDQVMSPFPEFARYKESWIASRINKTGPLALGIPWICYPAIDFLEHHLVGKRKAAFEWGMGGSSVFLRKRGCTVVSVEHSKEWFETTVATIGDDGVGQYLMRVWDVLNFRPVSRLLLKEPVMRADTAQFASGVPAYAGFSFREYVAAIDRYRNSSLDIVLVDGRARMACCFRALPKVRRGGILVLDNSDYQRYDQDILRLESKMHGKWKRQDFLGPGPCSSVIGWRTTIWSRLS
jgi:hypothetical protein